MITQELWLGTEASYYELQALLSQVNLAVRPESVNRDSPIDFQVINDVAVGRISGPMLSKSSWITRYLGVVTYEDIEEGLSQLSSESGIKSIVLDYDTPGGTAKGCKNCANFIRQYSEKVKPVYSHSSGTVASAGMWLYSAGLYHTLDEDAQAGSIGAILVHSEITEQRKMEGVTDRIFRSAPYKTLGHPLEKLSEEGVKEIEDELEWLHGQFVSAISTLSNIPQDKVAKSIATGKMYKAKESVKLGLADAVLPFGKVIAKVSAQNKPAVPKTAKTRK